MSATSAYAYRDDAKEKAFFIAGAILAIVSAALLALYATRTMTGTFFASSNEDRPLLKQDTEPSLNIQLA